MASNFNDTTPAAPAGDTNVKWQTDGAGNDSAYVGPGLPVVLGVFLPGIGVNSQVCLYITPAIGVKFPASAPNSTAYAKTAATGSTTYTLKKNGSSFATIVWSGSGTVGAWTQASDTTFNGTTDILEIDGPGTADATLANIGISLYGVRT